MKKNSKLTTDRASVLAEAINSADVGELMKTTSNSEPPKSNQGNKQPQEDKGGNGDLRRETILSIGLTDSVNAKVNDLRRRLRVMKNSTIFTFACRIFDSKSITFERAFQEVESGNDLVGRTGIRFCNADIDAIYESVLELKERTKVPRLSVAAVMRLMILSLPADSEKLQQLWKIAAPKEKISSDQLLKIREILIPT